MPKIGKAKEHPDGCLCYTCHSESANKGWKARYQRKIAQLEAENKKLREVLRKIAEQDYDNTGNNVGDEGHHYYTLVDIAQKALEE
jgi:hypothetical protein